MGLFSIETLSLKTVFSVFSVLKYTCLQYSQVKQVKEILSMYRRHNLYLELHVYGRINFYLCASVLYRKVIWIYVLLAIKVRQRPR